MESTTTRLDEPAYEDGPGMLLAGLSERMAHGSPQAIPAQWQRFAPYLGTLPGRVDGAAYGVVLSAGQGDDMDYMSAVEIGSADGLPGELRQLRLAPQRYAVFHHRGHVAGVSATWNAILDQWLPTANVRPADAPFLERYGPQFDPGTGLGGVDLMVPIAP